MTSKDLILVAGHAAFKESVTVVPDRAELDEFWVLQPFQVGEPPLYIEHARRGVVLTANKPAALLLMSGGRTRAEAGPWSEARTYHDIARVANWWVPEKYQAARADLSTRVATEDHARDSFENLLFGLCRFQQLTGDYPRTVTVVSWAFKQARFELHRRAIRFPASRFRFDAFNAPFDFTDPWGGEDTALRLFIEYPYGSGGDLAKKRRQRNPYGEQHAYATCPGLGDFFTFIENEANASARYSGRFPWEE